MCVAESWLTTVTVSPGCTVSFTGLKAKLSIVICAAAAACGELGAAAPPGALRVLEAVAGAGVEVVAALEQPPAASRSTAAASTT
ncbi:hypothetical protein GCM10010326_66420 [Streptomyces xanthochromogenes]|uniref:Uncharacterized protein n=1 Tax=Streptomyces xanthochromogenes TaxID=67384 RepID=A0ABQ3AQK5_9ACTN|nr:hypothetical protein GCM10010326_66420 [Streptomyces xanthochromogenes]